MADKNLQPPIFRKLRGYAFDPSLSLKIDTAHINNIVYKIPWEKLEPGPAGEYVEIIDYDPTVDKYYLPSDLSSMIFGRRLARRGKPKCNVYSDVKNLQRSWELIF